LSGQLLRGHSRAKESVRLETPPTLPLAIFWENYSRPIFGTVWELLTQEGEGAAVIGSFRGTVSES